MFFQRLLVCPSRTFYTLTPEAERARDEAQNAKKNAENARDKAQTAKEEAVKLKSFANLISTAALSRTEKGSNKATEEARIATEKARIATARADAADQRATEAARDAILAKSKATEAQQTEVAARQRLTETQQTLAETQESLTAAEHKLSETGWTSSDTEVKLDQAEQELAKTKLLVQRLRAQNQRLAAKVSEEHDNYTKTIQGMSLQKLSVLRNIVLKQIQAFLKTENIQQPETPSILGTGLTALGAQTSSILGTGLTALGGTFGSFFTGTTETSMNINEHEFPTTVLSQDAFDSFLLQKKRFIEKITQLITQLKQGKKYLRYDILAYACKLNAIDVNLLKRECENTNDDIKQRFIESIKRIMDYNIPNDTFFTPLLVAFDENYSTENLSRKLNIERPLV